MPRYFTLEQAQELLADVEPRLRRAVETRAAGLAAGRELAQISVHVQLMGGVRLDRAGAAKLARQRDDSAAELKQLLEGLEELGVLVKDLDSGLADFPTLYRGREVLLCWRLGERGIGHWHGVDEGFRGRKRIDRDFLDNHRGDPRH